ncbi:terminase large subunit domain-containing protein [Mycobacterium sp. SMC-2]|uniref:terminase large subunit domain-containing protein n=1 Tax=Mycobacterium sp. SMC-2 TaxID=2857058 RepID=UPI0028C4D3F3|nr:terminase large subunit [Mycobacterium sp. SMC-2]
MLPRGNGKSTLLAALAIWELFCGGESATVVIVAFSKEQAGLIFGIARQFVQMSDPLASRCQVGRDRLTIPARYATLQTLPAEPAALEGLDYTLALLDEAGRVARETYEVLTLAQSKRPVSTLVAIGTPPPDPTDSVLTDLRNIHAELGDDHVVWREFSANDFQHHPPDCRHCIALANPALGDFLDAEDAVKLLKTTREGTFRRARLCQLVNDTVGEFLPAGVWAARSTGQGIAPGAPVVIALDGSHSDDSTALVIGTVSAEPHFDVLAVWEKPADDAGWQVPIAEVEECIRQARNIYRVVELVADPWGWLRTMQLLEAEGLVVSQFPHSPSRLVAATTDLYNAAVNGNLTHSGNATLAAHIGNAVVVRNHRGCRIEKASRRGRKVDAAAALVMCHSRATWHGTRKPKKRYASFAN